MINNDMFHCLNCTMWQPEYDLKAFYFPLISDKRFFVALSAFRSSFKTGSEWGEQKTEHLTRYAAKN